MNAVFNVMVVSVICGTVLLGVFMICLSMPQSRLRAILLQLTGWLVAAFCAAYCISPVDILPEALLGPFGLPDDLAALVGGIFAAVTAWKAGLEKRYLAG